MCTVSLSLVTLLHLSLLRPTFAGGAQRFPDKVDNEPEAARALNVAATQSLARLCAERSALLLYISTDYVFPGTPGDAPYEADAAPRPPNLYGQNKLEGELAVLGEYERTGLDGLGVVLRVPVLYGQAEMPAESAVNVLMDVVWKAQDSDPADKMDHWAIRYPTNTEDVGRVCRGTFGRPTCLVAGWHFLWLEVHLLTGPRRRRHQVPGQVPIPLARRRPLG